MVNACGGITKVLLVYSYRWRPLFLLWCVLVTCLKLCWVYMRRERKTKQNRESRDPRASGPSSLHHQATKIVYGKFFFFFFLNLAVKYDLGLSILARLVLISYLSSNLFCFQYLCLIWFCKGKIQSPKKKALNLCSWMKNQEMSRLMNS